MEPALPQELIDRIVDFLHGDEYALCASALAHSSFLTCSQRHLFYSLVVPKAPSLRAERLLTALTAAPQLSALVRELRVQSGNLSLLRALVGQRLCPYLHTIAISCGNVLELGMAGALVHTVDKTVQKLYLCTGSLHARTVTAFVQAIGRTPAPPQSLPLVRLELAFGRSKTFGQPDSEVHTELPLLVDMISLPFLRILILGFLDPIWTMMEAYSLPWSSLDASIGTDNIPNMKELRFVFNTELSPRDMWREVTSLMPLLRRRGIVTVGAKKYGRYLLARNAEEMEVLNLTDEVAMTDP